LFPHCDGFTALPQGPGRTVCCNHAVAATNAPVGDEIASKFV
jgi:hypothetical protein